jgi:hypothetical protein
MKRIVGKTVLRIFVERCCLGFNFVEGEEKNCYESSRLKSEEEQIL